MPVAIAILRDPPAAFYPRLHGGLPDLSAFPRHWMLWLEIEPDENGFTASVTPTAGIYTLTGVGGYRVIFAPRFDEWYDYGIERYPFLLIISPEYVFYRDSNAHLAVPTRLVPAWVLEEGHVEELFNHLALYNRYFMGIVAPVFILVFVVFFITQAFIYIAAVWLFGHWQKLSGNMTIRERFAVCTFASVPAGAIGFAVGIFLPVFHIVIFQFLMIWFTYKAMKEYLNA